MVVRDQREDTVTGRFRDESLVIDVIRQLKASARLSDVSRLIIRSTSPVLAELLLGSLLDRRDYPIPSAAGPEDFLNGIHNLRFLPKPRPWRRELQAQLRQFDQGSFDLLMTRMGILLGFACAVVPNQSVSFDAQRSRLGDRVLVHTLAIVISLVMDVLPLDLTTAK
jgi:hypothetical protein